MKNNEVKKFSHLIISLYIENKKDILLFIEFNEPY